MHSRGCEPGGVKTRRPRVQASGGAEGGKKRGDPRILKGNRFRLF